MEPKVSTLLTSSLTILALWIYLVDMGAIVYLALFSFVPGVGTVINWTPTLLTMTAALILLSVIMWHWLTTISRPLHYGLSASLVFQTASLLAVTLINAPDLRPSQLNFGVIHDYGLRPGTPDDIEAITAIVATLSTLYNWSITIFLFIVTATVLSFVETGDRFLLSAQTE
jgi:hypothetical protein